TNIALGEVPLPPTIAISFSSSSANFSSRMRCCGLTLITCVANVVKNERNGSRLVGDSLKSSLVSCRLRTSCSSASLDCSTPGCSAATGDPGGAACVVDGGGLCRGGAERSGSP